MVSAKHKGCTWPRICEAVGISRDGDQARLISHSAKAPTLRGTSKFLPWTTSEPQDFGISPPHHILQNGTFESANTLRGLISRPANIHRHPQQPVARSRRRSGPRERVRDRRISTPPRNSSSTRIFLTAWALSSKSQARSCIPPAHPRFSHPAFEHAITNRH
jgi:hypothetical protein